MSFNYRIPVAFIVSIIYFLIPYQIIGWIIGESIKGVFIQMSMSDGDFIWYFITLFYFVVSITMGCDTVEK